MDSLYKLQIITLIIVFILIRIEGYNAGYRWRTYEYEMENEIGEYDLVTIVKCDTKYETDVVQNIKNFINLVKSIF